MLYWYVLLVQLLSVIVTGRTIGLDCEKDCNVDGTIIVCEHCIPQFVPKGVRNVRVMDNKMDLTYDHLAERGLFRHNRIRELLKPTMTIIFVEELNFTLDLESLYLRQNNVRYLNIEFNIDLLKHMKSIDLNDNTMELINPTFFENLTAI